MNRAATRARAKATVPTEHDPIDAMAEAVINALMPDNGRSNRCESFEELCARLAEDGVSVDPGHLRQAVSRLEDSARRDRPGNCSTGLLIWRTVFLVSLRKDRGSYTSRNGNFA